MDSFPREPGSTTSPVRVLWLIKGLGNGGAEQLLVSSAQFRTRSEVSYRVAYLLPWKDALVGALADEGVAATCLGARSSWDVRWVGRLRHMLRSDPVDVVHVHSPLVAAGARLVVRTLPRSTRPRLVTTEHNVWSSHNRLTRAANAATAAVDDATVAVSGAVRESMPTRLHARTQVVRYGVDVDAVVAATDGARDAVRAELGVGPDEILIGTVANFRRTKGYADLLAAATAVVAEVPRARFVAVGQGPQEEEMRALHAQLGLGDRFLFAGYRPDAVRVMSAFDIFCLASRQEGLPIAMLEALTVGLPVVATEAGGIAEFFDGAADAALVPTAEPELLAEALVTVAADEDLRQKMARLAAARRGDLAVERAVREMESIYAQLVPR